MLFRSKAGSVAGLNEAEQAFAREAAGAGLAGKLSAPAVGAAIGYYGTGDKEGAIAGGLAGGALTALGGGSAITGIQRVGQGIAALGEEIAAGLSRLSALERVAARETLGPGVTATAKIAKYLGGDWLLETGLAAAQGAGEGALIGAGLGYYSGGMEGLGYGLGAGLGAGAVGAGVGKQLEIGRAHV